MEQRCQAGRAGGREVGPEHSAHRRDKQQKYRFMAKLVRHLSFRWKTLGTKDGKKRRRTLNAVNNHQLCKCVKPRIMINFSTEPSQVQEPGGGEPRPQASARVRYSTLLHVAWYITAWPGVAWRSVPS